MKAKIKWKKRKWIVSYNEEEPIELDGQQYINEEMEASFTESMVRCLIETNEIQEMYANPLLDKEMACLPTIY